MTPSQIYDKLHAYAGSNDTLICKLHSACSPADGRRFLCGSAGSRTSVIDFDTVKTKADKERSIESRKSVDAVARPMDDRCLCFVELKSWNLLLSERGTERGVRRHLKRYESDLPKKLSDSMDICHQILGGASTLNGCRIIYILATDISVVDDGLASLNSNLAALAGSASDLKKLCNRLSANVMEGISHVETRYWECREFDDKISELYNI